MTASDAVPPFVVDLIGYFICRVSLSLGLVPVSGVVYIPVCELAHRTPQ